MGYPGKFRSAWSLYISAVNPIRTGIKPWTIITTAMTETSTPLPSAPVIDLGHNAVLQPPLSWCGCGPGLIILRPSSYVDSQGRNNSIDPEPLKKWAEESYAVVQITLDPQSSGIQERVSDMLATGINGLVSLAECENKHKFGLLGMFMLEGWSVATFLRLLILVQSMDPRMIIRRSLFKYFKTLQLPMKESWLLYTLIAGILHLRRPLSCIHQGVVALQSVITKPCIHIQRRRLLASLSLVMLTSKLRQLEWHTREASAFSRSI